MDMFDAEGMDWMGSMIEDYTYIGFNQRKEHALPFHIGVNNAAVMFALKAVAFREAIGDDLLRLLVEFSLGGPERASLTEFVNSFRQSQQSPETFSIRVAYPFAPLQISGSALRDALQCKFRSRIVNGAKGWSLGYHLKTSSRGYLVLTLFGGPKDLLSDLDILQALAESVATVQGEDPEFGRDTVMSLRIQGPGRGAIKAVAREVHEVFVDTGVDALYPVRYGSMRYREHVPFHVALESIRSILRRVIFRDFSGLLKASKVVASGKYI